MMGHRTMGRVIETELKRLREFLVSKQCVMGCGCVHPVCRFTNNLPKICSKLLFYYLH